jgi:CrcB protein
VGGAAGACCRVAAYVVLGGSGGGWPWPTFTVNLIGTFLLGYLSTRLLERLAPTTHRRPMLAGGFCGAFTTFSTLQFELFDMLRTGRLALALGYASATIAGGVLALLAAVWLVRRAAVTA